LTSPPLSNEERRGKTYFQTNSIQLARLKPNKIPNIKMVYALIIPHLLSDYIFLDAVKLPPHFGFVEVIKTADE
jgi:hypothetical protein